MCNIYDKPWRQEANFGAHIYRPRQTDTDTYGKDDLEAAGRQRQFVPERGFVGADRSRHLEGPVQFERGGEDPFNVSTFLLEAKKADKRPIDSSTAANRDTTYRKRERRD